MARPERTVLHTTGPSGAPCRVPLSVPDGPTGPGRVQECTPDRAGVRDATTARRAGLQVLSYAVV